MVQYQAGGECSTGRVISRILWQNNIKTNMLYFASLNKRVHSFSLTITGLNGVDVSCRSMRFPLPIQPNSSHHYTDSLVAITFYIEYSPSFVISVKKRARLSKHCCLKSLFRSERPNCLALWQKLSPAFLSLFCPVGCRIGSVCVQLLHQKEIWDKL